MELLKMNSHKGKERKGKEKAVHQEILKLSLSPQTSQSNARSQTHNTAHKEVVAFSGRTLKAENSVVSIQRLPYEIIFEVFKRLECYRDLHNFKCTSTEMELIVIDFEKLETSKLSQSSLKPIHPEAYQHNHLYYEYKKNNKEVSLIGVELENGSEYKTKERKIFSVYSFLEQQSDTKNKLQLTGILNDNNKSKFYLDAEMTIFDGQELTNSTSLFEFSGDVELSGIRKASPDWRGLFNEFNLSELCDISMGLKGFNHYLLSHWLGSSFNDERCLREKLLTLFQNTY